MCAGVVVVVDERCDHWAVISRTATGALCTALLSLQDMSGRLRLSYASNSRNPRATRVPIEQPRSLEHVTIFDLD